MYSYRYLHNVSIICTRYLHTKRAWWNSVGNQGIANIAIGTMYMDDRYYNIVYARSSQLFIFRFPFSYVFKKCIKNTAFSTLHMYWTVSIGEFRAIQSHFLGRYRGTQTFKRRRINLDGIDPLDTPFDEKLALAKRKWYLVGFCVEGRHFVEP